MKLKYISYLALVFRKFAWLMKSAVIQKCKRTFLKKYKKKNDFRPCKLPSKK